MSQQLTPEDRVFHAYASTYERAAAESLMTSDPEVMALHDWPAAFRQLDELRGQPAATLRSTIAALPDSAPRVLKSFLFIWTMHGLREQLSAAELSETGNLYVHLAQIHLLEERWEEAIAVLRKAIGKGGLTDPGTVELMLGIAYYNEQRLQEARRWFGQAQRSAETRQQAELWLQHVDRELEASGSSHDTGG